MSTLFYTLLLCTLFLVCTHTARTFYTFVTTLLGLLVFILLTFWSSLTLHDTIWSPVLLLLNHAVLSPELLLREDDAALPLLVLIATASIALFALSYSAAHPRRTLFLFNLCLFGVFMLALLQSNDMLLLFGAWEGIGVISYTLIAFTHTRLDSLRSGYKALLMNRVGDFGFVLAIVIALYHTESTHIDLLDAVLWSMPYNPPTLVLFATGIFLACFCKSAQYAYHDWLFDAMEGMTPVSALLHSATLVTAGTLLVSRFHLLICYTSDLFLLVALLFLLTVMLAAFVASGYNDVKRIIAYSTTVHIGLASLAAYACSSITLIHLLSHGWMKACLFILVGYAIHNAHAQDSRRLQLPTILFPTLTALLTLVTLHIAGFIGTSVASTKDYILQHTLYQFTTLGPSVLLLASATPLYALGYALATLHDLLLRYCKPTVPTGFHPLLDVLPPSTPLLLFTALALYQLEPSHVVLYFTGLPEQADIDYLGFTSLYALLLAGSLINSASTDSVRTTTHFWLHFIRWRGFFLRWYAQSTLTLHHRLLQVWAFWEYGWFMHTFLPTMFKHTFTLRNVHPLALVFVLTMLYL